MSGDVFSFPSSVKEVLPHHQELQTNPDPKPNPSSKKRRNLPGTPDPDAEVIALSPKSLMATNRFLCEICNKGFQRDQNLQLHRRGHNLPWKLKQRNKVEQVKKKVYICPEKTCIHHDPSRALGDLTGIKKHFSRKHGEKKWTCEKCSKKYAVQSDWKAHSKTCGTREYKCDCGTLFSRKDSFITHRAFCDALAVESSRITSVGANTLINFPNNATLLNQQSILHGGFTGFRPDFVSNYATGNNNSLHHHQQQPQKRRLSLWLDETANHNNPLQIPSTWSLFDNTSTGAFQEMMQMQSQNVFGASNTSTAANFSMAETLSSLYSDSQNSQITKTNSTPMSATSLLQKAAQIGSTKSDQTTTFFSNNFSKLNSSSPNTTTFTRVQSCEQATDQIFSKKSEDYTTSLLHCNNGLIGCTNFSTPAVSMNLQQGMNGMDCCLTRDFLGIKHEGSCQFLPQEMVKFASTSSSDMGLSHYSSSH
ncbi:unnamed protein product [Withania somnifera]